MNFVDLIVGPTHNPFSQENLLKLFANLYFIVYADQGFVMQVGSKIIYLERQNLLLLTQNGTHAFQMQEYSLIPNYC